MKKLISVLLSLAIIACVCCAFHVAAADDFVIASGVLVSYNGTASDVTLPDNVTSVGASAFEGNTHIRSVTIPSSVYEIGDRAFYGCTALDEVNGGENIAGVGTFAFRDTPYFDSLSEKYSKLGHVLLWYNGTSESVSLPFDCTAIAPYAFARCETLSSFRADGELVSIGAGAAVMLSTARRSSSHRVNLLCSATEFWSSIRVPAAISGYRAKSDGSPPTPLPVSRA